MSKGIYGELPIQLGVHNVDCNEMMFYQYLPIKLAGSDDIRKEARVKCFNKLILIIMGDFLDNYGDEEFTNSYIYLTAKHLYQSGGNHFNRLGYHSDGFLTNDVNYIWPDKYSTIFNNSNFKLTLDDKISMLEMEQQANKENEVSFTNGSLLRLNQYNIHRVAEVNEDYIRTFFKLSFSKNKYDLVGNSHNYLLDYSWPMQQRKKERNIPQSIIHHTL